MKYALIIPDGAADEPQDVLSGRTPLQAASIPNMDRVARTGVVGRADHVPRSMPPGSDVGTMSLFGYDPLRYHTGRAPLEAAAQGIPLGPADWAIRCNLVTIEQGVMRSFTAEQIPTEVGRELMAALGREFAQEECWEFHAGVSYRNLVIYRSRDGEAPFDSTTVTVPPHDITDQPIAEHLPHGPGADLLRMIMDRSRQVFPEVAANRARSQQGLLPATQVWLWGLGRRPNMEPFKNRFGVSGAVITAVDLLRGIGRLLGWEVIDVPGATGYLDTDYEAKGRAAVEALNRVDMIVVHVEATDEASHEGDAHAKVEALERIDQAIVGPVHQALTQHGNYRMLVCPDHPTFLRTRTHSHGFVPFALCGSDVSPDGFDRYDEASAEQSPLAFQPGCGLMPYFLT
ncbi:MAG: cofactor-independent phosphoglycerate mutase [Planctomycetes bacterium]|nr:cofactor-independent phosphoglycerate mutase [Planctomycetota bacterium]